MIDVSAFPCPGFLQHAISHAAGLTQLNALYRELQDTQDANILNQLLMRLRVTYRIADRDMDQIPSSGPTIVVSNHPCGLLEGIVLSCVLRTARPDTRILANRLLANIPECRELIIPVDLDDVDPRTNARAARMALKHLREGGLLVVFPAGQVANFHLRTRCAADPQWQPGVARIVEVLERRGPAPTVIPVHVSGRNSAWFYVANLLHPHLRTWLLPRELLNKAGGVVDIRIGAGMRGSRLLEFGNASERMQYLRWRSDVLGNRRQFKARTALPLKRRETTPGEPIAAASDSTVLAAEVSALAPCALLSSAGDLGAYIASSVQIPAVLREIGRLREITFRAAGEGTGRPLDLDRFDEDYLHLFLWHRGRHEVVGAYRLVSTDWVLTKCGLDGLYTASLFHFQAKFLQSLGPALELGRSFVRKEYQRSFHPLLLLWKGIGAFVAANPQYKTLFGPVSISAAYSAPARELMVSFLERYASLSGLMHYVKARHPLGRRSVQRIPEVPFDVEDLSTAVADIEATKVGVPVLLRHYLKLGGKLLGFSVDPKFADALDGLIVVDLTATEPQLLERYLGKAQAAHFLHYQKGTK